MVPALSFFTGTEDGASSNCRMQIASRGLPETTAQAVQEGRKRARQGTDARGLGCGIGRDSCCEDQSCEVDCESGGPHLSSNPAQNDLVCHTQSRLSHVEWVADMAIALAELWFLCGA